MFSFILSIFAFFWNIFNDNVLWYFRAEHGIKFANAGRAPPDLKIFPHYMQNRMGLWLKWHCWRPTSSSTSSSTAASTASATSSKKSSKNKPTATTQQNNFSGVLFIFGGLAEYSGRYDNVAKRFCEEKNFICFYLDNQGHGSSEGVRKYVEHFQDYVDDQLQFIKQCLYQDPEFEGISSLPKFALGHSMGGLIGVTLSQQNPNLFDGGVIISGPALEPDPAVVTPLLKKISSLLSNFIPKLPVQTLDPALVSNNKQIYELYVNDYVVSPAPLRARWATEMLGAMDNVFKPENLEKVTFPYLMIFGGSDKICRVTGAERFIQNTPVKTEKKLRVYDGAAHELFTDPEQGEQVFQDVLTFVDNHMNN